MMELSADEIAHASARVWKLFVGAVPGAWARRAGGVLGVVTGVELGGFNGVWGESQRVEAAEVARLLDAVRDSRMPHCMQLRPGWPPEVDQIARRRGLVRMPGEPLMALSDDRRLTAALEVEGIVLRELAPDEAVLHARVAAGGRVTRDEALYGRVISPQVLRVPGIRCYVGEVESRGVTTALSVSTCDCVGIFSVATLPEYRRRGFGSAVTARAVRDGLEGGARWAWLSASESGRPVYERMGFVALEHLDFWESTGG